jgi:hypothetical protein
MGNFMEIIVEPVNPQSLEFKMSEAGGVQCEQGEPIYGAGTYQDGSTWEGGRLYNADGLPTNMAGRNASGVPHSVPIGRDGQALVSPKSASSGGGGAMKAKKKVYRQPKRDTSNDPSWWRGKAPSPVPRPAPVNPSYGSQPANPMMQMLSNRGGKTVTGPQQALATALRGGGNG